MGRETHRRVAATAVAVVASVVGVLGPPSPAIHAAGTTPSSTPATAAATAIQLPAPAAVGQQTEVTTRIEHSSAAGTFEVVVSMSTAVTAVNPADGSYTTRSTIGTVDVPVGAELAGNGVNALVTRSFEQPFTAVGAAIPQSATLIDAASMTPEAQQSGRALLDAVSMVSVGFPGEPVAVGATWTTEGTVGSHGSVFPVTYQCLLTALDASTYAVEVSYTEVVSIAGAAGAIEATIAGSGSLVGSVSNPLALSATLHQTVDGIQGAAPLASDTSIVFTAIATGG